MQNFTPLSLSAAEKSLTVQKNKQKTKKQKNTQQAKYPSILPYGGVINICTALYSAFSEPKLRGYAIQHIPVPVPSQDILGRLR